MTEEGKINTKIWPTNTKNAYMLVYTLKDMRQELVRDIDPRSIPPHLEDRVKRDYEIAEAEESERREKLKNLEIPVITFEMIQGYNGQGLYWPDSTLYNLPYSLMTHIYYTLNFAKAKTVKDLRKHLDRQIPVHYKLWKFTPRVRKWHFKEMVEFDQTVRNIFEKSKLTALFIETEDNTPIFEIRANEAGVSVYNFI